jgi:hypothetical protein
MHRLPLLSYFAAVTTQLESDQCPATDVVPLLLDAIKKTKMLVWESDMNVHFIEALKSQSMTGSMLDDLVAYIMSCIH